MTIRGPWNIDFDNNCPPKSACDNDIKDVFRLVANKQVTLEDFKPHYRKFPYKKYQNNNKCPSRGTSLWLDRKTVEDLKKLPPNKNLQYTAIGSINKGEGPYEIRKNDGHVRWWIYTQYPEKNFKVI